MTGDKRAGTGFATARVAHSAGVAQPGGIVHFTQTKESSMKKALTLAAAVLVLTLQAGCDRRPDGKAGDSATPMSPSTQSASSPMGGASRP